jgi:hypothetical protein
MKSPDHCSSSISLAADGRQPQSRGFLANGIGFD